MSNTRYGNVIIVDTDATFAEHLIIKCIKFFPGTGSPTAVIKAISGSGVTVWETASASELYEEVLIRCPRGINVNVEGTGTKVYLYLE